jgi:hypothetical protein
VRSSTSSSRPAPPSGRWGLAWAVALAAAVAAAALLETQARRLGVKPSWSSGLESWCVEASSLGPKEIAIVGTSRALTGIEPGEFSRLTGRGTRQLSINATSMLPVLEWLASREEFSGVVLAETVPGLEFRAGYERHAIAERFIRELEDFCRSPARRLDALLARHLQTSLALRSPGFHLLAPYRDRAGAGAGRLSMMTVEATRFVRLEFRPEVPNAEEKRAETARPRPAGEAERAELFDRFAAAVRAIEARGGRVVFLFMPLTGRSAVEEELEFPRAKYWDRIAAGTNALKIHFRDAPALAGFTCPDGEHLDGVDAVRFTRELAALLIGAGRL